MMNGRFRFDWFGLDGRKTLPGRGPHWFVSRGANFRYISLGGFAALTVPWFWSRSAIENIGFERGWNMGYQSGIERGKSIEREKGLAAPAPRCTATPTTTGSASSAGRASKPRRKPARRPSRAALGRFMAAIEALPGDQQHHALERLATSMATSQGDAPETCLLCGWTDGCKPDCAVLAVAGLL